ncbi:tRNA pseudouridine(55) synthase TruB [Tistrella sp. BH-R2-4]|uniref:tRNA pseudouridine synthase B n=1 Tax=Tistrella arctica TaxID=3133430 RepID=A0ABU9YH94_9PROT
MSRRRRGEPIDGWLAIDKPEGMSSAQAVAAVKRITNAAKVGHAGTLDPLASGVLPVALGEATKTVGHAMDGAKEYIFDLRWGEARETDDREGAVVETSDHRPDRAAIAAALSAFLGEIDQVPPAYSAIKLAGRRAYALARAGEAPEMPVRRVRIDALELTEIIDADHARFRLACGKGTYARAIGRDLALEVGTVGHLSMLRRTRSGAFTEAHAITLEKLDALVHSAALEHHLFPVETALDDIPALALTGPDADALRNGRPVREPAASEGQLVRATLDGRLVALARVEGGVLRSVRGFNLGALPSSAG